MGEDNKDQKQQNDGNKKPEEGSAYTGKVAVDKWGQVSGIKKDKPEDEQVLEKKEEEAAG